MAATDRQSREMISKCKEQLKKGDAIPAIERLRLQCLSRGANGIRGLGRTFRIIDDDGSRSLDIREFRKGCDDFGLTLSKEESQDVFTEIDKDGSGSLDFDEFLIALRPPMSKSRVTLIYQAFKKLDRTGDGYITVEDMQGVYNARSHPKYQNGEMTEEEIFKEYLKKFEAPNEADGQVLKEEFINYYSGVSASIDNDAYFDLFMRKAYGL